MRRSVRPESALVRDALARNEAKLIEVDDCVGRGATGPVTAAFIHSPKWHKPKAVVKKRVNVNEWRVMQLLTEGHAGKSSSGIPTPIRAEPSPSRRDGDDMFDIYISRCRLGSLNDHSLLERVTAGEIDRHAYYVYLLRELSRVLSILADAHSQGIVHRDLKPLNLFIDDQARWCVGDWGSHKQMTADGHAAELSGFEQPHGTPYFNPLELGDTDTPEHTKVTPALDVWALGVIIGDLLGPEHHKGLMPWAEYTKYRSVWTAAVGLYSVAQDLHKPEALARRGQQAVAAYSVLCDLLAEPLKKPMTQSDCLSLLDALATLMTDRKAWRQSCASLLALIEPLMARLPELLVETYVDEATQQGRIVSMHTQVAKVALPSLKASRSLATLGAKPKPRHAAGVIDSLVSVGIVASSKPKAVPAVKVGGVTDVREAARKHLADCKR